MNYSDDVKVWVHTGHIMVEGTIISEVHPADEVSYWVKYTDSFSRSEVGIFTESDLDKWNGSSKNCECGSDKLATLGLSQPGHSHYCPVFKDNNRE